MRKKFCSTVVAIMLLVLNVFGVFGQATLNVDAVTVSKVGYNILVNGESVFICNKDTLGSKVGAEYFMTYTVKKVEGLPQQQGLVGTLDCTRSYPYTKGGILRGSNNKLPLLEEGATYFVKMTVAEGGFRYNVTRSKEDIMEDLVLEFKYGEGTEEMKYLGLWLDSGRARCELTNVHYYDANGNDLGIYVSTGKGIVLRADERLKNDTKIDHCYDIIVSNQSDVAISNLKEPKTSRVFMEYEVETASHKYVQEGVILSNSPKEAFPYRDGMMQYYNYQAGNTELLLLEVGAKYIISMERTEVGFDAYVQKTKDGVVTYHIFPIHTPLESEEKLNFFSLWTGEGLGSYKLTNFKCYDSNKNNLGVQCNKTALIDHYGLMEDYSGCEATYYCKETGKSFALYEDQRLKITESGRTQEGTYQISRNVMTVKIAGESEKYDYLFKKITDAEGNEYERLYNYTIRFETGTKKKIEAQKFSNKKGYLAEKPEAPILEGYEFEDWCLSDGTVYDFDKIVTESNILYAKYSGDGGKTFLVGEDEMDNHGMIFSEVALVVSGVAVLIVGAVLCVWFIRKGYKNGRINKN